MNLAQSGTNGKKSMLDYMRENNRRKDKYASDEEEDDVDKRLEAVAALADDRALPLGVPEGKYRTRGRWSPQSSFTSPFNNVLGAGNDRSWSDLSR